MIRSTFAFPAMLALLSVAGLVVALTGEGWRDLLSWAALSTPLLAILWAVARTRHRKDLPK
jgi:membrane protein implicated in regulation of membrane protease activity